MNSTWSEKSGWLKIPRHARELLMVLLAVIYLVTVYMAIIRIYLMHGFLVEVDCSETLVIFLF